jgi:hypothetical protein
MSLIICLVLIPIMRLTRLNGKACAGIQERVSFDADSGPIKAKYIVKRWFIMK